MENLISACRADAAELPPHTLTWVDYAYVIGILIFAMIGVCWTVNKVVDFAFRGTFKHFD